MNDCDDCPISWFENKIEDLECRIEELEEEIDLLKSTSGNGYEYPASTAAGIKSVEELKRWVENHNKHYRK